MGKYIVTYSTQAANDLKGIYTYICYNLSSPINANNQISRIRNAIRELDTFPNCYPIVEFENWNKIGVHKLNVDNYIIFYFVDDNNYSVDISRIFYGGRNIETITKEM